MEKINNYDEFKTLFIENHYSWMDKKKLEIETVKAFKKFDMYMLEDGYYFTVDTKPSIDKTMYYDDETPEPTISLQYFINENLGLNFKYDYTDYKKEINSLKTRGICCGNIETNPFINKCYIDYENKEIYPVFYNYCGNSRKNKSTVRELTNEEIEEYFKICDNLKKSYIERLTKYFNKYNKNIHSVGYWANR